MTEPSVPVYLIATDDGSSPDYAASRKAGIELAEREGGSVVLYDRSSESVLTDPYPVGPWSDEDDAVSADSTLEPDVLENLGRSYLAQQLEEVRARGIEADAYLGQGSGSEALERAVERYRPTAVVMPASVTKSSLVDKVKNNTWEDFAESIDADIRLVDADGNFVE